MEDNGYDNFLSSKALIVPSAGREVSLDDIHPSLFPFQKQLVKWAVRKGRCALFASTGLGKTVMQVEWARLVGERTLILAPLAVARQTVREAARIGVSVTYARHQEDAAPEGITITNYEMLEHFVPTRFGAVVLDESSILKHHEAKTRTALIEAFKRTPYRLCATATPAPNDIAEIANHAEFLGVMSRAEMLAAFFVHDDEGWRLKKHAQQPFYRWLASWGMALNRPSDLGYDDTGYNLPPLSVEPVFVDTDYMPEGRLFSIGLSGVTERAAVRRDTIADRVKAALDLIDAEPDQPWICWYGLLDEGRAITKAFGPAAVMVEGSLAADEKERRLMMFLNGTVGILVTHPGVAGMGLNLQHCARMVFIGLSDSWEAYFQCLRRCWRFGQTRPVNAYVVLSEPERVIYENVISKEREAIRMSEELIKHSAEYEKAELVSVRGNEQYRPEESIRLPEWIGGN